MKQKTTYKEYYKSFKTKPRINNGNNNIRELTDQEIWHRELGDFSCYNFNKGEGGGTGGKGDGKLKVLIIIEKFTNRNMLIYTNVKIYKESKFTIRNQETIIITLFVV